MAVKLLYWQERFYSIMQQVTVLFQLSLILFEANADNFRIGQSKRQSNIFIGFCRSFFYNKHSI